MKRKQFCKYTNSKPKFKGNVKLLLSGGDYLLADDIAKVEILNDFLSRSSKKIPRLLHLSVQFEKEGQAKAEELETV